MFTQATGVVLALSLVLMPHSLLANPNAEVNPADTLSDSQVSSVASHMGEGIDDCSRVAKAYQVDCMRYAIGGGVRATKKDKTANKANKALRNLETQLKKLVRKNRDKQAPKLSFNGNQLTAVRTEALAAVQSSAGKALSKTQTTLLKASSNAPLRFARISQALDSGKVLLRAA